MMKNCKIEEALQLFETQEAFITEGNNPLYADTMPEFVELEGDDDSNEED